ncbi:hypothetical protein OTU49_006088 [Cherax quadricarinatus]|uniref:Uncharacterized protein n=3 Tax=Cherax quadricarinatus TaxID=27406 RepID=A0AAW0X3M8_CHEQU
MSSSVESGIIPDTGMSCLDSLSMGESYDLFLTELSKTLPTVIQVADVASAASLGYPSSPEPQHASCLTPSPSSKNSCSAIVYCECSTSQDTSPSDAQESKL